MLFDYSLKLNRKILKPTKKSGQPQILQLIYYYMYIAANLYIGSWDVNLNGQHFKESTVYASNMVTHPLNINFNLCRAEHLNYIHIASKSAETFQLQNIPNYKAVYLCALISQYHLWMPLQLIHKLSSLPEQITVKICYKWKFWQI